VRKDERNPRKIASGYPSFIAKVINSISNFFFFYRAMSGKKNYLLLSLYIENMHRFVA
jgi:hypothetical protein